MNKETATKLNIPTEIVELPSKGLLYPKDNPLSSGKIEMKYMTAKEEDILTNQNYFKDGTVIDRLLQALIISDINYDDLLIGDKNAILIAARILGYGKDYSFEVVNKDGEKEKHVCDLTALKEKPLDATLFQQGVNEFKYTLPTTGTSITFKLLTHGDDRKIEAEIKGLQKISPKGSFERTTRFKYLITSVDGKRDTASIRDFVDNYLIAKDSRALRSYYDKISPDIVLKHYPDGAEEGIDIQIGVDFFWPGSDE
jgi:hypothetical protein